MVESGGVLHHGTYEEDDLVTWEALVFPRAIRSDGEPVFISETGASAGARAGRQYDWQNKRLPRGRPLARGTGATAEGGKGVGGLHRSFDVGELVGNSDPAEQRRLVLM